MRKILFLLLIAAGGYIYYQHGQIAELTTKLANLQSVYSSASGVGPTVASGSGLTADTWKSVAIASVVNAIKTTPESEIDPQTVTLSTTVDLTGDTVPEGIYKIGSSATGEWYSIFKIDQNKNISVLKVKGKDAAIVDTKLTQAISATVSSSYKLLPEEHAYYVSETANTSTTATPKLSCSLDAFSWNVLNGQFEYSQTLTEKYKPQVCK